MSLDAMKQALEALEEVQNHTNTSEWFDERVNALRLAIEQAEHQKLTSEWFGEVLYDGRNTVEAQERFKADVQQAEQQEPVAWMHWLHGPVRLFMNKDEAMMELERFNREYPVDADARQMRPLYAAPPQRQPEHEGCACRWDHDDNRVATCERHQGWLDVIAEWADRARAAEAALNSPPQRQPLTGQQLVDIELSLGEYIDGEYYDLSLHDFARAIERKHGIGGEA